MTCPRLAQLVGHLEQASFVISLRTRELEVTPGSEAGLVLVFALPLRPALFRETPTMRQHHSQAYTCARAGRNHCSNFPSGSGTSRKLTAAKVNIAARPEGEFVLRWND